MFIDFFVALLRLPIAIAFRIRGLDYPPTANTYLFRGLRYLHKDPTRAITDFDTAISLNSSHALAHHFRGMAHHLKGDYDKAISDYDNAIQYDPSYAPSFINRAEAFCELGDFGNSADDYESAVLLDPDCLQGRQPQIVNAYNSRGLGYLEKEEYDLAIADFGKAIQLDPEDPQALENRGRSLEAKGELSLAAHDFEAVHPILWPELYDPVDAGEMGSGDYELLEKENRAAVHSERAMEHFISGNYDLAIAWLDSAIGIDPLEESSYYNRGLSFLAKGLYDRSVADFNSVIGLTDSTDSVEAYSKRDETYLAMGDDPAAAACFVKRGLAYISEDSEARNDGALAVVTFDHLNYYPGLIADSILTISNLAIADFDAALYFDSRNVEAYRGRALAYRIKGEHELAEADFTSADTLEGS